MLLRGTGGTALLLSLTIGACSHVSDLVESEPKPTVVAVLNGEPLTLEEYETRYMRTSAGLETAIGDSMAAYEDFLERYVNLRIKLLAAKESGYYERSSIQEELHGYRSSFARPYLIDREVMEPVLRDLYHKRQETVEASHILVRVAPDALPADTMAAYSKLTAVRDSALLAAEFGDLAMRHSDDPSARMSDAAQGYRGNLGRFSAGRMIKIFEDMAYTAAVGDISPVFRTSYGYHILKVHARTPSVPDINLSHIITRIQGGTEADSVAALEKIREAKARLDAGEAFEAVAADVSEDPNSNTRGGDIGTFRHDAFNLDRTFFEAAFGLVDLGDISDVVQSAFGYHLIKLTGREEPGTFEEEYDNLERMASRLPRVRAAEERLAKDIRDQFSVTVDTTALLQLVAGQRPDSVKAVLQGSAGIDSLAAHPIASLGDTLYTLEQLASFANDASNQLRNEGSAALQVLTYVDDFLDEAAVSHAALQLEETDEEFAGIVQEFRDGLVLFRFMEDSVWTAATTDSSGLQSHFEANRASYHFPDRKRILQIYSRSDSLLAHAVARIDTGLTWLELADFLSSDTLREVQLDTVLVEDVTNSIFDQALDLAEGERTDFLPYRSGHVALFSDGIEPARLKTFDEARAMVVNEHQEMLENRLIGRLRRLYGVETYPERLILAFRPTNTQ